ncbi:uncharacterized protein LOC113862448 [Abrus precatorius]|uniref:Uncharacterized protein LOC113862448 n=1 Tax=Abrus precatorius TaxID=3816 RepID=A0A8B8L563_ABRPR|nr:uncharacterized protein LOC113862448 [Abrus precatorius]
MEPFLRQTDFWHVALIVSVFDYDRTLISALVERWRLETHTSYFSYRECTITLEDVVFQLGLHVDKIPMSGCIGAWEKFYDQNIWALCEDLLGVVPDERKQKRKVVAAQCSELPLDVLHIITKKLDFDDLFQFAGVCKSWTTVHRNYWRNFMASQEPLLIQRSSFAKRVMNFYSISEERAYSTKLDNFWELSYSGFSNGYIIMASVKDELLLMNPFTRRKKQISMLGIAGNLKYLSCYPLVAFAKGSEDLIIAVIIKRYRSLHVYHTRTRSWVTYLKQGNPWLMLDFVVLNNAIYVLTKKAEIGVLNLNSGSLEILELKNTPILVTHQPKLVSCDDQLLVVEFDPEKTLRVYKVDLSKKEYVKLENLGDIALFYGLNKRCYALSNPGRFGYENNCVYCIHGYFAECEVYSWNNELKKWIVPRGIKPPPKSNLYWADWCFRHQRYEVDCSVGQ